MPRQLRIEYAGAVYHVMARGNRRGDIVLDDADRLMFVATLVEACKKTGWQVLAGKGQEAIRDKSRVSCRRWIYERRAEPELWCRALGFPQAVPRASRSGSKRLLVMPSSAKFEEISKGRQRMLKREGL